VLKVNFLYLDLTPKLYLHTKYFRSCQAVHVLTFVQKVRILYNRNRALVQYAVRMLFFRWTGLTRCIIYERHLQCQLATANETSMFSTYLDIRSPEINIVAPLGFQSSILLRLGMDKLFVIRRVDIYGHHCHSWWQRPGVSPTMQCVWPRQYIHSSLDPACNHNIIIIDTVVFL